MERIPEVNRYRELGLCTIPLKPKSKKPSIASWTPYQERLPTEEELNEWFPKNGRQTNIGIVCGGISSGLVIGDFEKEHLDLFWKFAEKWKAIRGVDIHSETMVVDTGGGGKHVFLRVGKPVESQRWPAGEIKAEGTYAVAPPSVHPDTGETYKIANPEIGIVEINDLKDVGIELKPKSPASAEDKSWVTEKLKGVPEGERDATCHRLASYFRNLLPEDVTIALLLDYPAKCDVGDPPVTKPFTQEDVIKCVKSAYKKPLHSEVGQPKCTYTPGVYQFDYKDLGVNVKVDRIADRGADITAEVTVRTEPLDTLIPLHHGSLNLRSTSGRAALVKALSARATTVNWDVLLGQVCFLSLEKYRQGEPLETLPSTDELKPPEYLVYPILPKNQPTVIYGDGGTGKSQFAQFVATCLMTGWGDNPLELGVSDERLDVLYLDWETDKSTINHTLNRLKKPPGLEGLNLHYRRCYFPFAYDLARIQAMIEETGAKLLIVDSLAAAVGTDLNPAEGATKFLARDIRQLNITSLIIAHVAKDERGKKTIYGSVFFKNYARSVWELQGHQEVDEENLEIGLFCRKSNMSKLFNPIGLRFAYFKEGIVVEKQAVGDVPEFAKTLTLKEQLKGALRHGKVSVKELAEELDSSEGTIRATLNRNKNTFINQDEGWGLKENYAQP